MKKDIGIPGVMFVVAIFYLLGQIASCHESNRSNAKVVEIDLDSRVAEATITTDGMGRVAPANNVDSIYIVIGQIKFELTKMDSMTRELDKQNKEFDSLLNSD